MAVIQAAIRFATNVDELKRNLLSGIDTLDAMKPAADRATNALGGTGLMAAANKTAVAIERLGGVTKLTAAEQDRANTLIDKAIQKYDAMGIAAPTALRNLSKELSTATAVQADFADRLHTMTTKLAPIGQAATTVGIGLTAGLTAPIVAMGYSSLKASIDFESSFAGVKKTVDGMVDNTGQLTQFGQQLQQGFRDLAKEIPVSVNELAKLGETAGALGIPKDAILDFTKVMAELGVTTNLTSDQAATSIAKIQNIFGAAGVDTDRFGSALVHLGNVGASTEAEIVELARRIAGAGSAIGLSQAEVLGFSAAIANVGIEAEAGGSSISRVFADIAIAVTHGGKDVSNFAKVSGLSIGEFSRLFRADAAQAVTLFIEGLGRIKQSGGDLIGTIEALGFSELRQADLLKRLAGNSDDLRASLGRSAEGWDENNARTKEAAQRFGTTENQLKLLGQQVNDIQITLGNALVPVLIDVLKHLDPVIKMIADAAKDFAALPEPIKEFSVVGLALVAAGGPMLVGLGSVIRAWAAIEAAIWGAKAAQTAFGVPPVIPGAPGGGVGFGPGAAGLALTERLRAPRGLSGGGVSGLAGALAVGGFAFGNSNMTMELSDFDPATRAALLGLPTAPGAPGLALPAALGAPNIMSGGVVPRTLGGGGGAAADDVTKKQQRELDLYRHSVEALTSSSQSYDDVVKVLGNDLYETIAYYKALGKENADIARVLKIHEQAIKDVVAAEKEWKAEQKEDLEATLDRIGASRKLGEETASALGKSLGPQTVLRDMARDHAVRTGEVALGYNSILTEAQRLGSLMPDMSKQAKENMDGWRESTDLERLAVLALADAFEQLGQSVGGSAGIILQGASQLAGIYDAFRTGNLTKGEAAGQAAGVGFGMVAQMIDTGPQADTGNLVASGAAQGAAAGAPYAAATWGASVGVGAAVGALAGWYQSGQEWRQMARDISRDFGGIKVSEDFAKLIEDLMDTTGLKSAQALTTQLDKLIEAAGGLRPDNLERFTGAFHDAFSMLERGELSVVQTTQIIDKNWATFAAAMTDSTGRLSDAGRELMELDDRFGTHSQAIADYRKGQAGVALGGLGGIMSGAVDENRIGAIGKAVDDAQKAVDALNKAGKTGSDEWLKSSADLALAIHDQTQAADEMQGTIADLGTIALGTFAAAVASGMSFSQALNAAHPGLATLAKDMKDLGISSEDPALKSLLFYDELFSKNKRQIDGLSNLASGMTALGNMGKGMLGADTFGAMQRTGVGMINDLYNQAFTGDNGQEAVKAALLGGQDFLHAASAEAKSSGSALDAEVAMKIQQSKDLGIWVEAGKKDTDRVLDKLDAILRQLQGLPQLDYSQRGAGEGGLGEPSPGSTADRGNLIYWPGMDTSQTPGAQFASGSGGVRDFGSGTWARLHGREIVQTEAQHQQTGADLGGALKAILAALDSPRPLTVTLPDGQPVGRFLVKLLSGTVFRDAASKAELLEGLDLAS